MYIIYSLLVALGCMILYRMAHRSIDAAVAGVRRPWLRRTVAISLKGLSLLVTATIALFSILAIILAASSRAANNRR